MVASDYRKDRGENALHFRNVHLSSKEVQGLTCITSAGIPGTGPCGCRYRC